jgi:hypothetical protein
MFVVGLFISWGVFLLEIRYNHHYYYNYYVIINYLQIIIMIMTNDRNYNI